MSISSIITLVILAGLIGYIVFIYNTLVSLKHEFKNAFSQIEVQLKRRYDLIPNLVETAKGFMSHERETLESVIEARNTALAGLKAAAANPGSASAMGALASAENKLQSALGGMNIVMENYPDLKANDNMMQLAGNLTTTENQISSARQLYNHSVTEFNIYRNSFPATLFANIFGHKHDAMLLEFDDAEKIKEVPKVSF